MSSHTGLGTAEVEAGLSDGSWSCRGLSSCPMPAWTCQRRASRGSAQSTLPRGRRPTPSTRCTQVSWPQNTDLHRGGRPAKPAPAPTRTQPRAFGQYWGQEDPVDLLLPLRAQRGLPDCAGPPCSQRRQLRDALGARGCQAVTGGLAERTAELPSHTSRQHETWPSAPAPSWAPQATTCHGGESASGTVWQFSGSCAVPGSEVENAPRAEQPGIRFQMGEAGPLCLCVSERVWMCVCVHTRVFINWHKKEILFVCTHSERVIT